MHFHYSKINSNWYLLATEEESKTIENNIIVDRNFKLDESIEGYSDYFKLKTKCEESGYGIYIEDNKLYVVDDDYNITIDTPKEIGGKTYKLIGSTTISD